MILLAKAISRQNKWIYGYPIIQHGKEKLYNINGEHVETILVGTVCYRTGGIDKNGKPLFTGDIINDFGGGTEDDWEVDTEHETYQPNSALPPMRKKADGNFTRLGEIIFEGGTVRVRTKELGYNYNIHGVGFGETEYHSNIHDHLIKQ